MKTEIRNRKEAFTPFEVVFVIQNACDLRDFRDVFGNTTATFGGEGAYEVYEKIKKLTEEVL